MKILQYKGDENYVDPRGRFEASPFSLVEFTEDEADSLLEGAGELWQLADTSAQSTKRRERR
jgi:hypothetical protein